MAERIKKPGPTRSNKVPEATGDFKPVKPVLQFTSFDRFLTILGFWRSFPRFFRGIASCESNFYGPGVRRSPRDGLFCAPKPRIFQPSCSCDHPPCTEPSSAQSVW